MRRSIGYCLIISVIIVFFSSTIGFAADALYRLMHNDHDALVVGTVTKLEGDTITVVVKKQLISSKDLNFSSPKRQIPIKGTIIIKGVKEYALFHGTDAMEGRPKKGDYVLASLKKGGRGFKNAWGVFKTDSNNYRTLNILYPEASSSYTKMDAAAIKAFVNSNGKKFCPSP